MRHKRNEEFARSMKDRMIMFFKKTNLTQADLGRKLGTTKNNVNMFLSRNNNALPSIDLVVPLCKEMNISPNALFGWESSDEDHE